MYTSSQSSHYLATDAVAPLNGAGQSWSISLWLRYRGAAGTVVEVGSSSARAWALRVTNAPGLELLLGSTVVALPQHDTLATGLRRGAYITIVMSGATIAHWVDGVRGADVTTSASIPSVAGAVIRVSRRVDGSDWAPIAIAELAMWDMSLSDIEAEQLSRGVSPADVRAPQYYWPLRAGWPYFWDATQPAAGSRVLGIAGGDVSYWDHPRVGHTGAQAHRASLVAYAELDSLTYASADIADPALSAYAPLAPTRRLRGLGDVSERLSAEHHGLQIVELDIALDASDSRPYHKLITDRAPRAWYPGGMRAGMLDVTGTSRITAAPGASEIYGPITTAPWSRAWSLPGTSGAYVAVSAAQIAMRLDPPWTVLAWVMPTAGGQRYAVNAGSWAIIYGYVAGTIEFYAPGYSGSDPRPGSQISVPTSQWSLVAYTHDGSTWAGYRDATQVFSTSRSFGLNVPSATGYIGAASPTLNNWQGGIGDVVIIPAALSQSDIAEIYAAATIRPRDPALLVGEPVRYALVDTAGGIITYPRCRVVSASQRDDTIEIRALSEWAYEARTMEIAEEITAARYPTSRDVGATMPRVFGSAYVSLPHLSTDEASADAGVDYCLGDWSSPAVPSGIDGAVVVSAIYWDSAPQQTGLERAIDWVDVDVVSYPSATVVRASGDVTRLARPGTMLRVIIPSVSGAWQYARVTVASYDSASDRTDITIDRAILSGTPATGVIREMMVAPESGSSSPGTVVTHAGGLRALVVASPTQGGRDEVVLLDPGNGYTAGSTVTAGGLTLRIVSVGGAVQVSGEVTVSTTRYRRADGAQSVASVRLPAEYTGGVVARVHRPEYASLRDAFRLAVPLPPAAIWISDVGPTTTIGGYVGGRRAERDVVSLIEEFTRIANARVMWHAGAYLLWDDAYVRASLSLGLDIPRRMRRVISGRDITGAIELHYGPRVRAQRVSDIDILDDIDDHPGRALLVLGPGERAVATCEWIEDVTTARIMVTRLAAEAAAEATRSVLECEVMQLAHIELGDLIAIHDPSGEYHDIWRVRRIAMRDGIAILDVVRYNVYMTAAAAHPDSTASMIYPVTTGDVAHPRQSRSTQLLRNTSWAALRGNGMPEWWWYGSLSAWSRTITARATGGAYLAVTSPANTTGILYPTSTATGQAIATIYARPRWRYLFAAWLDRLDGVEIEVVYIDANGAIIGTETMPLYAAGPRNGLDWPRAYVTFGVRDYRAVYIAVRLRLTAPSSAARTWQIDAPLLTRIDGRMTGMPEWRE